MSENPTLSDAQATRDYFNCLNNSKNDEIVAQR